MIFNKTKFDVAYTIDLDPIEDERGFFQESWNQKIFSYRNEFL